MPIDWIVAGKVALAAGQAFMAHLQGRRTTPSGSAIAT
jgi:hypothetical protein